MVGSSFLGGVRKEGMTRNEDDQEPDEFIEDETLPLRANLELVVRKSSGAENGPH